MWFHDRIHDQTAQFGFWALEPPAGVPTLPPDPTSLQLQNYVSLFEQAVVNEKAQQAKERKTTRWVQYSINGTANPWKMAAFKLSGKVNIEVPLPYGPLDIWHLNPTTNLNNVRMLDLRIARQDFAEHYLRSNALHCTATARILIPAECSAVS